MTGIRELATRLEINGLVERLLSTRGECQKCGHGTSPGVRVCMTCRPTIAHYGRLGFCWRCHKDLLHGRNVGVDTCDCCSAVYTPASK